MRYLFRKKPLKVDKNSPLYKAMEKQRERRKKEEAERKAANKTKPVKKSHPPSNRTEQITQQLKQAGLTDREINRMLRRKNK